MRRQSLRPRQIDVHGRMRIIRSQDDLVMDDDGSGVAPSLTTFDELVATLEEQHQSVAQRLKRKKNIPIPVILDVEGYEDEVKDDYEVPTSYVRFQSLPTAPQEEKKVEIDLELADIRWLQRHPRYGEDGDPRYQLSLSQFEKMLDALEKASAIINPNTITLAEAEEVFAKQLKMVKTPFNKVTVDVYNYWMTKRQALKRPILRKYWPQTPLNDTNPHLVFRPREKERYKLRKHRKNDMEGFRKMQQLRADFERIRQLVELVRRREKCKRLSIDFLDEIRRQAVHEMVHQKDGELRKPVIPTEDERERNKKRKKKKKKHKKEISEEDSSVLGKAGVIGGSTITSTIKQENGIRLKEGSSTGTPTTRVVSFMEYDTSQNYTMDDYRDRDLTAPIIPTYPIPSSHLMATVFHQPPKFRCRGRIGRGGRLIIDRIPVPPRRYYGPLEVPAAMRISSGDQRLHTWGNGVFGSDAYSRLFGSQASSVADSLSTSYHAPILVNENAFRPPVGRIPSVASTRLQAIYDMSDSEDELLEPLTTPVFESSTGSKKSSAKAAAAALDAKRPSKFALQV